MPTPAPAACPWTARSARALLAGAVLLVMSCDNPPTDVERESGLNPDVPVRLVSALDPSICGTGRRSATVSVFQDPGTGAVPAPGVVVAVIDPGEDGGTRCWKETGPQGVATLTGLSRDDQVILLVNDEIGPAWPHQQFVPPEIPSDVSGFYSDPADTGWRTVPALVYGSACTTVTPYANHELATAVGDPCIVGGPGLTATVVLGADNHGLSTVIEPRVCYTGDCTATAPGEDLSGALIAALWEVPCSIVPWLDDDDCGDPSNVKNAALIQAGDVTETDGRVSNGLSVLNNGTTWLELVGYIGGRTVVGSLEVVCDETGCDEGATPAIWSEPGICDVYTYQDEVDPAGAAALDVDSAQHGYGMAVTAGSDAGGFESALLQPIYDAIVIKISAIKNSTGPVSGITTLRYSTAGSAASRKIDVKFGVDAGGRCYVNGSGASGSGLVPGLEIPDDICRRRNAVEEGYYEFFIEFRGLPSSESAPLSSATFIVKTDGDALDAAKNSLNAAAIPINLPRLTNGECVWRFKNQESKWRIL